MVVSGTVRFSVSWENFSRERGAIAEKYGNDGNEQLLCVIPFKNLIYLHILSYINVATT